MIDLNNTTDPESVAMRQELQKKYHWSSLPGNPLPMFHPDEESARRSFDKRFECLEPPTGTEKDK